VKLLEENNFRKIKSTIGYIMGAQESRENFRFE